MNWLNVLKAEVIGKFAGRTISTPDRVIFAIEVRFTPAVTPCGVNGEISKVISIWIGALSETSSLMLNVASPENVWVPSSVSVPES